MKASQCRKAERFRELHRGPGILVLGNAWDAASARILELAGAPAIGTTSAGVAWSLGFPDGQRLSRDLLLEAVGRIVAAVEVPVTADIEAGYGVTATEVSETVRRIIGAGAVGVNLEDGIDPTSARLVPEGVLVEKIAAIRNVARTEGVPLFVNARTDVYFLPGEAEARLAEAVRRGRAYVGAGADGFFAPGIADPAEIERLAREIAAPLNVYAFAGVPPAKVLERLGVRRVSVGCGPMQATLGLLRRIAGELFTAGTYPAFTEGALSVGEINGMFRP